MRYIIILIALLAASCQSTEEHGHAHDAAGGHIDEAGEIRRVDYTRWTDKTELFVEFPVLVVGKTSRFAAHFTVLNKHQPVREGSVTVSLIQDEKGIRHTVEAPSSPGIFSPSLQPRAAGNYQLIFDITTPQYQDRIVINDIRVFADAEEAISAVGDKEEDGGAISFFKESKLRKLISKRYPLFLVNSMISLRHLAYGKPLQKLYDHFQPTLRAY